MSSKNPNIVPGWLMTQAQRDLYFALWNQVCKVCGWDKLSKMEKDERRRELHVKAGLGPCSVKVIDHLKQFDAVRGVFMAIIKDADVRGQMRQIRQPKQRLLWAIQIRQAALVGVFMTGNIEEKQLAAERSIMAICKDKFGTEDLSQLSAVPAPGKDYSELEMLRNTIERWISTQRQARKLTGHELHQLAQVACPKSCVKCKDASARPMGKGITAEARRRGGASARVTGESAGAQPIKEEVEQPY